MIVYYGMVATPFPKMSDKYKEMVDLEVATLIEDAYKMSSLIVKKNTKDLIESANILKKRRSSRSRLLD
jgi:ATP-dependent Zn protease